MRRVVDDGSVVAELSVPGSDDVVVLLDPDNRPAGVLAWHPFQNVLRLSPSGEIMWRAELVAAESTARCWVRVEFDKVLTAWTYSYVCELDPDTGRIVNTTFVK